MVANNVALLGLLVAGLLPTSPLTNGLRYVAAGYILVDILLRARSGYLRRRPYWTRESWRRFLVVCSVPAGALAVFVSMVAAFEWRLPIVGASGSTARTLWALGIVGFMILGVSGLVVAVHRLENGEPSRQFAWPRWLTRGPRSAA